MKTEPKISLSLDKEEQKLAEAIDSPNFKPKLETVNVERADVLRRAAKMSRKKADRDKR